MANETISSAPSRSGLEADRSSRRDAKMKERAERRKKRDKDLPIVMHQSKLLLLLHQRRRVNQSYHKQNKM